MTEQQYINATTLAKIRIAVKVLDELALGELLKQDAELEEVNLVADAEATLSRIAIRLEERLEEGGEDE